MSEKHTRRVPPLVARKVDGTTIVTLHGEIDLVTAIPLASRLDAFSSGPHPDLVLDLRPVSFIDCAGLGVLCRTRNRVGARHGRLRLVTESGGFLRVLRAAGLGGVFEVHPRLPSSGPNGPISGREPVPSGPALSSARPM
ncbi:STAS domain-containing protein [Streptomyces sp. NBC_00124]|uniref:STAS domain-containing protein n=1 Tax=Streptomyces sp. NBC_00124 TaxID=2975662 RepID=UPI0022505C5D|nr:STAS domain-containing protein [Streptomyces sp. NBC_00124]MCX5367519.1 STAS domain-containing protein [Streptomyces sp. NBC_00124]